MAGLTNQEIYKIVNGYIGVSGGYLGSFSYQSHADFYPIFCDLNIDPYKYEGTTRQRFMAILGEASPEVQAKIIRGVLERFPIEVGVNTPATRTQRLYDLLEAMAQRLEGSLTFNNPQITSAIVEQAIRNIEILIQQGQPVSCVDRIHTALHGYLIAVCEDMQIPYGKDDGITRLFKFIRQQHPAFKNLGACSSEIERILQSFSTILDALNPIRNNASAAHPNETLLGKQEALLVINVGRTILHYIDGKIEEWNNTIPF